MTDMIIIIPCMIMLIGIIGWCFVTQKKEDEEEGNDSR